jgi:PAS domain S-box-containing protein
MSSSDKDGCGSSSGSDEALWRVLSLAVDKERGPHSELRRESSGPPDDRIIQAKHEWETTVDTLSQHVCLLDEHGSIVRTNRAVENWQLGRVADVKGKSLHALLHPDCKDPRCYLHHFWPRVWDTVRQGNAVTCETDDAILGRRLSIHIRPVVATAMCERMSRAVAIIDDVTELRRAEVVLQNSYLLLEQQVAEHTRDLAEANVRLRLEIGEHQQAEQALRKSEESYRRLVDTMIEGLVAYDSDGRIVYVNDSLCRMLGFERAELVDELGKEILSGVHQCTQQDLVCPCGRNEMRWHRKSGEEITVQVSPQRLEGPAGEFAGCFAVVTDISDRKRAEEALRRSETDLRMLSAQLMAAQEAERKRIASELHDSVGQMLSALKFQLENTTTLLESGGTQAVTDLIGRLVPKIQSAVDEVRRISMDLRPSMLDDLGVLPTITWFCREFQGVYEHLRLETVFSVREEEVPPRLKTVIYRIVQEALNNVARHARASSVQIALERRGATLEISVHDNGVGFEPASFVPRADTQRGLGLNTMRERAETTGGIFRLESSDGGGTLVHVAWPCQARA